MYDLKEKSATLSQNLEYLNLKNLGSLLHRNWQLKQSFANSISNKYLNKIYNDAIAAGCFGGKLLGAGGGGFFMFYCEPTKSRDLQRKLELLNTKIINFEFEKDGLKSWIVRKTI